MFKEKCYIKSMDGTMYQIGDLVKPLKKLSIRETRFSDQKFNMGDTYQTSNIGDTYQKFNTDPEQDSEQDSDSDPELDIKINMNGCKKHPPSYQCHTIMTSNGKSTNYCFSSNEPKD